MEHIRGGLEEFEAMALFVDSIHRSTKKDALLEESAFLPLAARPLRCVSNSSFPTDVLAMQSISDAAAKKTHLF